MAHPKFRALADAAAYCEKHGVPFDWITKVARGYVLRKPSPKKPKKKPAKAKAKRRPKPRRPRANDASEQRACKAKTPEQRRARGPMWKNHKRDLRTIAQAENEAAGAYHEQLEQNAKRCKRERRAVNEGCKGRRDANAAALAAARAEAYRHRSEDWGRYRKRTCGEETSATRHGSQESDDLVMGSLPRSMHAAWKKAAALYPVSWGVDRRLEKFQEDQATERTGTHGSFENFSSDELEALEQTDEDFAQAWAATGTDDLPF